MYNTNDNNNKIPIPTHALESPPSLASSQAKIYKNLANYTLYSKAKRKCFKVLKFTSLGQQKSKNKFVR